MLETFIMFTCPISSFLHLILGFSFAFLWVGVVISLMENSSGSMGPGRENPGRSSSGERGGRQRLSSIEKALERFLEEGRPLPQPPAAPGGPAAERGANLPVRQPPQVPDLNRPPLPDLNSPPPADS